MCVCIDIYTNVYSGIVCVCVCVCVMFCAKALMRTFKTSEDTLLGWFSEHQPSLLGTENTPGQKAGQGWVPPKSIHGHMIH
jgi:hypothetical protein